MRSPASRPPRGRSGAPEPRGFIERPWGGFETLSEGPGYKVKRLLVMPGQRLSLQRHHFRAESWVVVSGAPRVIVSGRARRLRAREAVMVPTGAWHRIENHGAHPVLIIEVQHGPYLGEDDIVRRHDDYGRANGSPAAASLRRPSAGRSGSRSPSSRNPKRTDATPRDR